MPENEIDLVEVFKNPLKNKILIYLFVYGELSLTELRDKLRKSKSTVHRHIQDLIQIGFVEESKEEKVRGSIKAKFYSISKAFIKNGIHYGIDDMVRDSTKIFETGDEDQIKNYFKMMKTTIKTLKKPLEIMEKYGENISKSINLFNPEEIQVQPLMKMIFLNPKQIKKFKEYLRDFWKKVETLFEEEDNGENGSAVNPFYFSFVLLNLKNLLEFEQI